MAETDRELFPGQEARISFGRTLKLWRLRAGWKQDTLSRWGKSAGFSSVTDAVFNKLERGQTPQPLPLTFIQLGLANDRLHRQEYGAIADRRLMDQIKAQEPICRPDGQPWTAVDFFAHFCGLEDAPEWARKEREWAISEEAAERLSNQQREMFLRHAQDCLMDRQEAWRDLQQHCTGMTREQVAAFKLVLGGHKVWKPAELAEMTDSNGRNPAIEAMQEWCDSDELCAEFRELCPR
jgi:hypothetical protein